MLTFGIDRQQLVGGRVELLAAHVGGGVNDLALKVGEIDNVEIDHTERAYARSREIQSQRRTESTRAHAKNLRSFQLELPIHADFGHDQVARIAENFIIAKRGSGASCFSKSCHGEIQS